jgi:glycosyltransferase involved in cell wall biosynthesis
MLSWEYPPYVVGGLGKHVSELAPALAQQGVTVHVVTPLCRGGQETETDGDLTVHRVPLPEPCDTTYDAVMAANRALQEAGDWLIRSECQGMDLIHNHDWLTSFAARELKRAHKLPLVATIHATERGRGRGELPDEAAVRINDAEWWLTYEAWRVITCANYMAHEVHAYFDKPEVDIDIIPNGVDPTPFRRLAGIDLTDFRRQYALPEGKLVFHVGRMVHEKGVELLVRAARLVLDEVPLARFVIAGKGPELDRLRALVEELGLDERVTLLGFVSDEDRNRLFRVADCAVFPSLYEPFGIVALEAMAAGTPVVASAVGGLEEVVRHAETGITVYPNDVDSCAWGIVHTLQFPDWARQRAQNAMNLVNTIYSWDTIAEQTLAVYRRVAARRQEVVW